MNPKRVHRFEPDLSRPRALRHGTARHGTARAQGSTHALSSIYQTNKQEAVTDSDPTLTQTNKSLTSWLYFSRVQRLVRGPEAVGGGLVWVDVVLGEGHHVVNWILSKLGSDALIRWICADGSDGSVGFHHISCFSDQTSDMKRGPVHLTCEHLHHLIGVFSHL